MSQTTNSTCDLESLPCGQLASVEQVGVAAELHARLAALGLQRGKLVQVIRRAGLGGPLHLRLGTTEIILRRKEAACIQVSPALALSA